MTLRASSTEDLASSKLSASRMRTDSPAYDRTEIREMSALCRLSGRCDRVRPRLCEKIVDVAEGARISTPMAAQSEKNRENLPSASGVIRTLASSFHTASAQDLPLTNRSSWPSDG